jgi:hypothetical protein
MVVTPSSSNSANSDTCRAMLTQGASRSSAAAFGGLTVRSHGRLREMQANRGASKMQLLGEGDEDAEMAKFHEAPLRIDSPY